MIAEVQKELNLLSLVRSVNLTYGTNYRFDEIENAFDEYRTDALRAQIAEINKPSP